MSKIIRNHSQSANLDEAGAVKDCTCNWCNMKRRQYQREQATRKLAESRRMTLDTSSNAAPSKIDTTEIKRYVETVLSHYCNTFSADGRQTVEQTVVRAMNDHPALSRFVTRGATDDPSTIYGDLLDLVAQTYMRQDPSLPYTRALGLAKTNHGELARLYGSSPAETRPDPLAEQQQRQGEAGEVLARRAAEIKKANPSLSMQEALHKAGQQLPDLLAAYNNQR